MGLAVLNRSKVSVGFEFPVDNADQWDGFNDKGIEHFSGDPYSAVGREVTQNVIDAIATKPARIDIQLVDVPTDSVPGISDLKKMLALCQKESACESPKAKSFFEQAHQIIGRKKISVLQLADYNTTGAKGPCQNGTPYFALVKASGQSKKPSDTTIGSFGIGKYAPFVVSGLRTIFISTVWANGSSWEQYVQGKSILMSHKDKQGQTHQGTGYWGIRDKCMPVRAGSVELPDWLLRAKIKKQLPSAQGTTLSILAFKDVPDWEKMLAAVIAENFFGSIERGALEATVGEIALNSSSIRKLFADKSVRGSLKDMPGEPDKFDNSSLYLDAFSKNSEVLVEETENLHLGNCKLRILVREGLPKKVALLRDGMLITDELIGLRRFPDFKEFVAVFECRSKKGLKLLRAMEPPRHNNFEPDRLLTDDEKKKGRVALKEIKDWVRDMLKRHAQDPVSEVTTIDELKDFFADEAEDGSSGKDREENPSGNIIIRARPLSRKEKESKYDDRRDSSEDEEEEGDGGGSGGDNGEGGGRGKGGGSGDGEGEGSGADKKMKDNKNTPTYVHLTDVRSIPLSNRKRRVAFTPDYSGEIRIIIQDSGADTNRKLTVNSSSLGAIAQGVIDGVKVKSGQRCDFEVELAADFDGAMRVLADAV